LVLVAIVAARCKFLQRQATRPPAPKSRCWATTGNAKTWPGYITGIERCYHRLEEDDPVWSASQYAAVATTGKGSHFPPSRRRAVGRPHRPCL